tara:strand:- start:139 stop:258 length:120 start_codon:yes stop_codon:yes gene_type:complete
VIKETLEHNYKLVIKLSEEYVTKELERNKLMEEFAIRYR